MLVRFGLIGLILSIFGFILGCVDIKTRDDRGSKSELPPEKEAVQLVVEEHQLEIDDCHLQALKKTPKVSGRLAVSASGGLDGVSDMRCLVEVRTGRVLGDQCEASKLA